MSYAISFLAHVLFSARHRASTHTRHRSSRFVRSAYASKVDRHSYALQWFGKVFVTLHEVYH